MNELEAIRLRLASVVPERRDGVTADLERAIEIATERITAYDMDVAAAYNTMDHAERERKRAEDAALTWSARCEVVTRERDQARADVLKLRDHVREGGTRGYQRLIDDTEHYENFR